MQAWPTLALAVALVATPAAAQSRFFDHETNRWEQDAPPAPSGTFSALPRDTAPAPARVALATDERPGTVIVDTQRRLLFLVENGGTATRYPIGVGREGFGFSGTVRVGQKAEWPDWIPPAEMRAREAAAGRFLPERVAGGAGNPLGARALYLYRGGRDTLFRIHGTNQPWTVGKRSSSGCIRMRNEDVTALYARVPTGARVVVIGPGGQGRAAVYRNE